MTSKITQEEKVLAKKEALSSAKTPIEIREAVMLLPDHEPANIEESLDRLSDMTVDEELLEMAIAIVQSRKLESQSWDDAWSGLYPNEPSQDEIEQELKILTTKADRIIAGGSIEHEYDNQDEHIRMIYLESAKTFSLYGSNGNND